jgi:hypothetical protein
VFGGERGKAYMFPKPDGTFAYELPEDWSQEAGDDKWVPVYNYLDDCPGVRWPWDNDGYAYVCMLVPAVGAEVEEDDEGGWQSVVPFVPMKPQSRTTVSIMHASISISGRCRIGLGRPPAVEGGVPRKVKTCNEITV